MTKETIKVILQILHDRFSLDDLDQVEFVMEYERKTGEKIPTCWLDFSKGKMKTVKLK